MGQDQSKSKQQSSKKEPQPPKMRPKEENVKPQHSQKKINSPKQPELLNPQKVKEKAKDPPPLVYQFKQAEQPVAIPNNIISLPLRKHIPYISKNGQYKVDNTKCMYFCQGPSKPYTHDFMQLESVSMGKSTWRSLTNESYTMDSKVDVFKTIEATPDQLLMLNRLGTFVCSQHKWGFVLLFDAIDKLYDGQLDGLLENCIKILFFQRLLKKYSYYVMEDKTEINIRDIKSTELDRRLTAEQCSHCPILFRHQLEQVGWMLNFQRNPVFPVSIQTQYLPVFDTGFYINPQHTTPKLLKLTDLPQKAQIKAQGAILASDVGTGKTASMLHLCILNRKHNQKSLIVTPDSILHQWAEEIEKFLPGQKYQLVENPLELERLKLRSDTSFLLVNRRSITEITCKVLAKIQFKRMIIDEVHQVIKLLQKTKSRIFNSISAQFIWGVTGTPHHVDYLQNLNCIAQLLRFPKKFYDLDNIVDFRRFFLNNCIRKNCNVKYLPNLTKSTIYSQLQVIESLVYRAKLIHSIDEQEARKICFNILPYFQMRQSLNNLQVTIKLIEKKLNDEIEKVKQEMLKSQNKQYSIKLKTLEGQNNFYRDIISLLMQPSFQCVICLDEKPTAQLVVTQCLHYYCVACYEQFFVHLVYNQCPVCKQMLVKQSCLLHPNIGHRQNKIETIMCQISKTEPNEKIIIFTQFHNLVQRMAQQFQNIKMPYMVLRGQPSQINYRLSIFRKDPSLKILLLSVEQAASGINLTQANHVYFAHPLMGNDYQNIIKTYEQCIGRVRRIGQNKPVFAKLFVGKATIEQTFKKYFN